MKPGEELGERSSLYSLETMKMIKENGDMLKKAEKLRKYKNIIIMGDEWAVGPDCQYNAVNHMVSAAKADKPAQVKEPEKVSCLASWLGPGSCVGCIAAYVTAVSYAVWVAPCLVLRCGPCDKIRKRIDLPTPREDIRTTWPDALGKALTGGNNSRVINVAQVKSVFHSDFQKSERKSNELTLRDQIKMVSEQLKTKSWNPEETLIILRMTKSADRKSTGGQRHCAVS